MTQPMHTYLPTSKERYPTRRPWMRLGSLLALTGYMGQLACQVVLASGFCLSHSSPVQAMEDERIPLQKGGASGSSRETLPSFEQEASIGSSEGSEDASSRTRIERVNPYIEEWAREKGTVRSIEKYFEAIREIIKCPACNNLEEKGSVWEAILYYHSKKDQVKGKGASGEGSENSGYSGATIIKYPNEENPEKIIKKFQKVDDGLRELVYSLMAFHMHKNHDELKMVAIRDAFLCPDALSFVMERALGNDIHYFVQRDDRYDVVRACARYLGTFHIRQLEHQAQTEEVQGIQYLAHAASFFHKLSENPTQSWKDQRGVKLFRLEVGAQSNDLDEFKSNDIIGILPEGAKERCIRFIKRTQELFEKCSGYVYRALKPNGAETERPYWTTITHGDAHRRNFFYNNDEALDVTKDSLRRVTMIDYSSIMETYGNIGDPAQDIGRFLGSLWDWASENPLESEEDTYELIRRLQEAALECYIDTVTKRPAKEEGEKGKEESSPEGQYQPSLNEVFRHIFIENCNFYKLRYYRAIFNSSKNRKTNESKERLLRYWMREMERPESPFATRLLKPEEYIRKGQHSDRKWVRIEEKEPINNLPGKLRVFIEGAPEGSPDSYLTRLWRQIHEAGSATLTSQVPIAGMGGIGKTSLALEYAHEALEKGAYNLIWWLPSEQPELSLKQGYEGILIKTRGSAEVPEGSGKTKEKEKEGEESPIKKLKTLIEHYFSDCCPPEHKWLLIYDNARNPESLEGLVPQHQNIHALITSRNQGWHNSFNLQAFHPEDSVKYLLAETGLASTIDKDKDPLARKVAEKLDHLPVALSLAANYVKLIGGEAVSASLFEEFLQGFERDPSASRNPLTDQEPYDLLVGKTYDMLEEELGRDLAVSQHAKDMMVWCAYLNPDLIPEGIFLEAEEHQGETAEALKKLYDLSLIKKSGKDSFSVHRLVQRVILKKQVTNEPLLALSRRIETLFHQHVADDGKFAKILTFLPHVLSLLEHSESDDVKLPWDQAHSLRWIGRVLDLWWESSIYEAELGIEEKRKDKIKSVLSKGVKAKGNLLEELLQAKEGEDSRSWIGGNTHPRVYNALGLIHAGGGYGLETNDHQGREYLEESFNKGDIYAPLLISSLYYNGLGAKQDYQEAMAWLRKAADRGNDDAMNNIGGFHLNGHGVEHNYQEAMVWFRKAANLGNAGAMNNIGTLYYNGKGVKQDYQEAMVWFRKASDLGYAMAMYSIGVLYLEGKGVDQSYQEAMAWFRKAADRGNANAMHCVGALYYNGRGIEQNCREAMAWFRKAADRGNAGAMKNIGVLYANGRGVEQDYKEAIVWYKKAADLGNAQSIEAIREIGREYKTKGIQRKGEIRNFFFTKAKECFEMAASLGDVEATEELNWFQKGAPKKDKKQAKLWLDKAKQA